MILIPTSPGVPVCTSALIEKRLSPVPVMPGSNTARPSGPPGIITGATVKNAGHRTRPVPSAWVSDGAGDDVPSITRKRWSAVTEVLLPETAWTVTGNVGGAGKDSGAKTVTRTNAEAPGARVTG